MYGICQYLQKFFYQKNLISKIKIHNLRNQRLRKPHKPNYMSQFVVSARKYRPQRFDEVVGQEHVSLTLKNAIQNDQLAHAFLFCGPRGVGKTTCARILAKVLNCENRTKDFEACNTCSSCTSFNKNASFNIIELDAASNNSVEHIRALIEQVRFQPQQGQYKIFIIDEVHMLSQQAFNAFLKTLEEPPPYAIFILATTEKHKIIPTILSRCQIFDFKRIQIPRMVSHLEGICKQEGIKAEKEGLHIIAQKADGALRDALSIFDRMTSFASGKITYDSVIENLNVLDYDYYFKVVEAMVTEDVSKVLLIFDEIFKKGFDPDIFINGLAEHLRNLLVCKDEQTLQLLEISDTLKKQYLTQAKLVPSSFLLTALNIANDCDINYKMARHKRLHVEMAIIKMTYIGRAVELAKNPPASALEKKTAEQSNHLAISNTASYTSATKEEVNQNPSLVDDRPPIVSEPVPEKQKETPEPVSTIPPKEAGQEEKQQDISIPNTSTTVEEKTSLKSTQNGSLKLGKTSKYDMPSLTDLTELDEEEEVIEENTVLEETALLEAWKQFIPTIESPSVKECFKGAIVKIKDEQSIEVEVGSQMSKTMVQQEKELVPFLRKILRLPSLMLEIKIDAAKAKELVVTKKILSTKDKYLMMREKNPLVEDLSKRLGLKPDNE